MQRTSSSLVPFLTSPLAKLSFPLAMMAFPLMVMAGCEQKPAATTPPPAASPAAAPAASAPAGDARTVGFELEGTALVGALQIDIAYTGPGRFVGDKDAVACETKVEGALSSYNHIVEEKTLRAAFVAVKGFSGPSRFSECKYQGEGKVEDFKVTVRDSSSPDLTELTPPPVVKVVLN